MRTDPAALLRAVRFRVVSFALAALLAACGDDEDEGYTYPSLVTEFVELYADASGQASTFTTDSGTDYAVNTPLQGWQANSVYRLVLGYEPTGDTRDGLPVARVYRMESAVVLEATNEPSAADDPTGVAAVWRGSNYLNLHLLPETQGGAHFWGYRVDSVGISAGGTRTAHLSLYHRQPGDPYSYSTTIYATLPLYNEAQLQEGDSLTFTILTFDGRKTWHFAF